MKKSFSIKKAISNVGDLFASWGGNKRKEGPTWDTRANAREQVQPLIETLFCFWTRATHDNIHEYADTAQAQQSFLVAQFDKAMIGIQQPRRQTFEQAYRHFELGFVELTKGSVREALDEFRNSQKSATEAFEHADSLFEKAEATRLLIGNSLAIEAGEKDKLKEKIQHHLKKLYHVHAVHSAFWKKTSKSTVGRLYNKLKSGEKAESTLHIVFGIWFSAKKVVHFQLDRPRRKGRTVPFPANWEGFWQAASDGDQEEVLRYLDEGVPIDCTNEAKWTALIHCAEHGHIETVKTLLDKGAKADAHDRWGYTGLLKACEKGQYGAAMELILHKANPNSIPTNGMSPLMYACKDGQSRVAECLIRHRADIRTISQVGWTPIGMAEKAGHRDIADMLRKHLVMEPKATTSSAPTKRNQAHVTPIRQWHDPGRRYLEDDDEPVEPSAVKMDVGPPSPRPQHASTKPQPRQLHSLTLGTRQDSGTEGAGVGVPPRKINEPSLRSVSPQSPRGTASGPPSRGDTPLVGSVGVPSPRGTHETERERMLPGSRPHHREARPQPAPAGMPPSLALPNLLDPSADGLPKLMDPDHATGLRSDHGAVRDPTARNQLHHDYPSFPSPQIHHWSPPRSPKPSPSAAYGRDAQMRASVSPPTFSPSPIYPAPTPAVAQDGELQALVRGIDLRNAPSVANPRSWEEPAGVVGAPHGSPPFGPHVIHQHQPGSPPPVYRPPATPPSRAVDHVTTPPPARSSPYHQWAVGAYLASPENGSGLAGGRYGSDLLDLGGEAELVATGDDGWSTRRQQQWHHGPSPVKQWWRDKERLSAADGSLLGTHEIDRYPLREPYRPSAVGEPVSFRPHQDKPAPHSLHAALSGAYGPAASTLTCGLGRAHALADDSWNLRAAKRLAKHRDWAARSGMQDMSAGDDDHEIGGWSNDPIWVSRGQV